MEVARAERNGNLFMPFVCLLARFATSSQLGSPQDDIDHHPNVAHKNFKKSQEKGGLHSLNLICVLRLSFISLLLLFLILLLIQG